MGFKLGFRLQQDLLFTSPMSEEFKPQVGYTIRRARTQFRGYLYHGKLDYFIQLSMDRGFISLMNAEYRWKPNPNTTVSFGQLRPPTGRQFQTVSYVLQMADRSTVSRFFSLGFDIGITASHYFTLSDDLGFKVYGGITNGEGGNKLPAKGGLAYTGRVEIFPFGKFHDNGDYRESDLYGEPSPKLSIGTAYYYNRDANNRLSLSEAELWSTVNDDIKTFYVDGVFKYEGYSLLAEYIHRDIGTEILVGLPGGNRYAVLPGGTGFSIQGGKVISKIYEPTLRVSVLNPSNGIQISSSSYTEQYKYTIGFNYYMIGRNIKMQTETSLIQNEVYPNGLASQTNTSMEVLAHFTISF